MGAHAIRSCHARQGVTLTTLVELLEEDGVRWDGRVRGENRLAHCLFHDDDSASMSVHVKKGLYKCFACDAKGDAVTYLVEKRGMAKPEAVKVAGRRKREQPTAGNDSVPTKDSPASAQSIRTVDRLPRHESRYDYQDANGKPAFTVLRWFNTRKNRKEFTPYFQGKKGGKIVWGVGYPPKYKSERPLYRLPALLAAKPDQQVVIVEGEKCADAFAEAFPKSVVTSWPNGAQAAHMADLTPLADRSSILLLADADAPGHEAMQMIATRLIAGTKVEKKIRTVLPEPGKDLPEHGDIADVLTKGVKHAAQWIRDHVSDHNGEGAKKEAPTVKDAQEIAGNDYYRVVGHDGDMVTFVLRTSAVVNHRRKDLMQPNTLLSLAPEESWWCDLMGQDALTAVVARAAGTAIIREAEKMPKTDPARMRGRGAHLINGDLVWNLGDTLLQKNEQKSLDSSAADGSIWIGGAPIAMGRDDTVSASVRADIAARLCEYRWLAPSDSRAMLGWMVSSVIGGALDWRPHLWLVSEASQGKTWFVENVVEPIHQTLGFAASDPTEAGIARIMGNDSLPLVIDEAEPDQSWLGAMLRLCRVAAGGFGARVRADGGGTGATQFYPRFSAMLMSTTMPDAKKADRSRFLVVALDNQGVEGWPDLRKWITQNFRRSDLPARLRRTMIHDTQAIIDKADVFLGRMEKNGIAGREAAMLSAIEAGWWWWTGEEIIDRSSLGDSISDVGSVPDSVALLEDILQCTVRIGQHDVTLMELVARPSVDNADLLSTLGLRRDGADLLIVPDMPRLRALLGKTKWKDVNMRRLLMQMDGAFQTPNPRWFAGHKKRAIVLSESTLEIAGISFDER